MKRLIDRNEITQIVGELVQYVESFKDLIGNATSITTVRGFGKVDDTTVHFACMIPLSILKDRAAPTDLASLKELLSDHEIALPCSGDFYTLAGEDGEIDLYKTDGTLITLDASWTLKFDTYRRY